MLDFKGVVGPGGLEPTTNGLWGQFIEIFQDTQRYQKIQKNQLNQHLIKIILVI